MQNFQKIGIVGAGITGLTAARALRAAGHDVVVYDKGRNVGGRVATRVSREGHQFDHGAQYINPKTPGFRAVIEGAMTTSAAASWILEPGKSRYVGSPSMVDFPAHIARAVTRHQGVEVTKVMQTAKGWRLTMADGDEDVDRLVLAVPAPQAAVLLAEFPISDRIAEVEMSPCLTLMAAFSDGPSAPFAARKSRNDALSWIANEASKPGRAAGHRFVAQASEAYSRANLEAEKPEIAAMLMPLLAEATGFDPNSAVYTAGHRWRYARVTAPLGEPYLVNHDSRLFVGGDWCLGARVESAWESGTAIARAIIGS